MCCVKYAGDALLFSFLFEGSLVWSVEMCCRIPFTLEEKRMSRSFVRLMAGFALVAVPMVAVEAQTCEVAAGSCGVDFDATLNVPVLASLDVNAGGSLAFPTPNWAAFFANPQLTYTVAQTQFTVRSNSPYSIAISAGAWDQPAGAGRVAADVTFDVLAAGDACAAGVIQARTIASASVVSGGLPVGGLARELCLALEIPGNLASNKLIPGDYTLPLTLTISAP